MTYSSPYTRDLRDAASRGMNPNAGIWPQSADPLLVSHRFADADGNTLLDLGEPDHLDAPIVLTSIDYGFPDIQAVTYARPNSDGEDDQTLTHAGRTLSATFLIRGDDQHPASWYLDRLRGMGLPSGRPYLYARELGWDDERRLMLRPDQFSNPLDRANGPVITAQASWRVPDGIMESPDLNEMTITSVGTTVPVSGVGMNFPNTNTPTVPPASGGVMFAATTDPTTPVTGFHFRAEPDAPGAPSVVNAGNANTYPVIRIYGPVTNPLLTNLDTGDELDFGGTPGGPPGLTLVSGEFIEINMRTHTVLDLGTPGASRLNTIDFTRSSFWHMVPGENRIALTGDVVGSGAQIVVLWRDTWI